MSKRDLRRWAYRQQRAQVAPCWVRVVIVLGWAVVIVAMVASVHNG